MNRNTKTTDTISAMGRITGMLLLGLLLMGWASAAAGAEGGEDGSYTTEFFLGDREFKSSGKNLFYSLVPGYRAVYRGEDDGETVDLVLTVTEDTRRFTLDLGGKTRTVETRVVEEREWEGGELVEVSRNYFAVCSGSNDVFYFGEEVDDYEDGEIVGHGGAWLAGEENALPGLIMPGTFLVGSRYFQEVAPGVALDRAENAEMGVTISTPAGTFENCVRVMESSVLDAGATSEKVYCPGVGMVKDDALELVELTNNPDASTGTCGAEYDAAEKRLHIPNLSLGEASYWLDLILLDEQALPVMFRLEQLGTN